jgi:hypothetical protein
MGLLLDSVKLLNPKLDHNTLLASDRVDLLDRNSAIISRRFRKLEISFNCHASRTNTAKYLVSRTNRRSNPGPIGVILIVGPTHRFANSQNEVDSTDFDKLI